MSVVTPCVSPQLARALAARLRDAVAAGEQLSSFAYSEGAGAPAAELRDGEELAVAHDFLMRVLHGVSDPLSWRLLAAAVSGEQRADDHCVEHDGPGVPIDVLADLLELPRLVITERANALIQLGVMARDLEHDSVAATPAGEGLFELACELEADIARWLTRRRRT
ncbi:MAG: hypothetical protein ACYC91_06620 [Solirubrobacteraceae bacterium]